MNNGVKISASLPINISCLCSCG